MRNQRGHTWGKKRKLAGNTDNQFPSRDPDSHGEQDLVSGVQVIKCPAEGDDGVLAVHLERRGVGRCVRRGDYWLARWAEGGNCGEGYGGRCGEDAEVDVCGRRSVIRRDMTWRHSKCGTTCHVVARAWAAIHVTGFPRTCRTRPCASVSIARVKPWSLPTKPTSCPVHGRLRPPTRYEAVFCPAYTGVPFSSHRLTTSRCRFGTLALPVDQVSPTAGRFTTASNDHLAKRQNSTFPIRLDPAAFRSPLRKC